MVFREPLAGYILCMECYVEPFVLGAFGGGRGEFVAVQFRKSSRIASSPANAEERNNNESGEGRDISTCTMLDDWTLEN